MTKVSLPVASMILIGTILMMNTSIADVSVARQTELVYLLRQDCGSCHGMTLRGGLGPALLPELLIGKSEQFLSTTILEGRPGTAMPAWKGMLNKADASWLAHQLQRGVQ